MNMTQEERAGESLNHFKQSIYDLVHKSEKSCTEIAEILGMHRQILINKANPNNVKNWMTVNELHAIQLITGNDVVLRAMQSELVLHTLKDAPVSILEAMISNGKECGDVFAVVQNALADNRLTERERSDILRELNEAKESLTRTELAVIAHGRI
jgi:hypothetical protein